jgi:hypothetical protein
MSSGARGAVLGTAILAALVAPPAATAQQPTFPLEVRGVTAVNGSGGAVRITFTNSAARLYRRVAGRTLIVRCERVDVGSGPLLLREDRTNELVRTVTAPRRRRPIRLRARRAGAGFDVCKLVGGRMKGRRANPRFVTTLTLELPLTQEGAAFLHERRLGDRLVAALDIIAANGRDERYPAFADVADVIPGLVQLASPDATPATGKIGLYTDTAQHVTVASVSVLGRRLFIDVNGEILSSNVPEVVAGQEN